MTQRIYAIGDIHGQLARLEAAHARIEADRAQTGDTSSPVVHLGDLTDRGPDSQGVVRYLIEGICAGAPWIVIKGNHDRMFTRFLELPSRRDDVLRPDLEWLHPRLGGQETLNSYGVETDGRMTGQIHADALKAVPDHHRRFLELLPLCHRFGDLLFVHAGIRPGVPLDAQIEDDLIWIRKDFLEDHTDHGPLVIHGHTVVKTPEHHGNRVNLDSGAGYGDPLTAAVFEDRACWILEANGRRALQP